MSDQLTFSKKNIGIFWWGSFGEGGSIGDLLVLQQVISLFEANDISFKLYSWIDVDIHEGNPIDFAMLQDLDVGFFVCGPIVHEYTPLQDLITFLKSRGILFFGLNVSLIDSSRDPFNFIIAREGAAQRYFDLAVLAPCKLNRARFLKSIGGFRYKKPRGLTIGLALRHHQDEYTEQLCNAELVEQRIEEAIEEMSKGYEMVEIVHINHNLSEVDFPYENYDNLYNSCDIVLTTRFHGVIMSTRCLIPFVAIDQIIGGAKLTSLLGNLKWINVLPADCSTQQILDAINIELEKPNFSKLLLLLKLRSMAKKTRKEISTFLSTPH